MTLHFSKYSTDPDFISYVKFTEPRELAIYSLSKEKEYIILKAKNLGDYDWAPTAEFVVFPLEIEKQIDIYGYVLAKKKLVRFTQDDIIEKNVKVSPNNKLLLFTQKTTDTLDIYSVSTQGGSKELLLKGPKGLGAIQNIGWINDQTIFYKTLNTMVVYDITKKSEITKNNLGDMQNLDDLSFRQTKNGRYITFKGSNKGFKELGFYGLDLKTDDLTLISELSIKDRNVNYSSDGKHILYTTIIKN